MPEALQAVIRFLSDEVGMQRIEARHDPRNPNSGVVRIEKTFFLRLTKLLRM